MHVTVCLEVAIVNRVNRGQLCQVTSAVVWRAYARDNVTAWRRINNSVLFVGGGTNETTIVQFCLLHHIGNLYVVIGKRGLAFIAR